MIETEIFKKCSSQKMNCTSKEEFEWMDKLKIKNRVK
jgi:hypothetical protein